MAKIIFNNFIYKILALVIAIALWFICINMTDPITQVTLGVSVSLQNTAAVTSSGKYIEVINNSDRIRVTLKDSRSVISNISSDNITAVADASKMTEDGKIPIEITAVTRSGDRVENISSDKEYVTVDIEDLISKQLSVEINVSGKPASGHIMGDTNTSQNVIFASGPVSAMEAVARAAVEIDVSDANADINTSLPIVLLDEEGEVVRSDKITLSKSEVTITAYILNTKTVGIEYTTTGIPAEGYRVLSQSMIEPQNIIVAGRESALSSIQNIVLTEPLDVSGLDTLTQFEINIKNSLPSGIRLINPSHGVIIITLQVEEEVIDDEVLPEEGDTE